jgi:hypothetical protein
MNSNNMSVQGKQVGPLSVTSSKDAWLVKLELKAGGFKNGFIEKELHPGPNQITVDLEPLP